MLFLQIFLIFCIVLWILICWVTGNRFSIRRIWYRIYVIKLDNGKGYVLRVWDSEYFKRRYWHGYGWASYVSEARIFKTFEIANTERKKILSDTFSLKGGDISGRVVESGDE